MSQLLDVKDRPVVAIDEDGVVTFINAAFTQAYGWSETEIIGQVVTKIMPPYMRDAHNFGFSRFLITEAPRILNKPLPLPVYCKDSSIVEAEHFITGDKQDGTWRFVATITPMPKEN